MQDIQSKFNSIAQSYDSQRTRLIPCFDDFYGIAIYNLELDSATPSILDLGAGTGLFSQFVLQRYPNAQIELVDISTKMLDIAKQRFADMPNISVICQDFTTFSSQKKYDAIVSSLAIHHLADEDKRALFDNIYSMLKPNGLFINAEQSEGETPYLAKLNHSRWEESVTNSDLSDNEISAAFDRVKLDKRSPLSSQLEWLKNSGFSEVDCLYKYYDFTVIYCKK